MPLHAAVSQHLKRSRETLSAATRSNTISAIACLSAAVQQLAEQVGTSSTAEASQRAGLDAACLLVLPELSLRQALAMMQCFAPPFISARVLLQQVQPASSHSLCCPLWLRLWC
jgi:hypothetical protein